jgi:hypothetical protein
MGIPWIVSVLIGHAVWTLGVPIALTEQLFPDRRDERWLRTPGLIVAGVALVLGSFVLGFGARTLTAFHTSVWQVLVAVTAIVILAGIAMMAGKLRKAAPNRRPVPAWWVVAGLAFVAGSAHMLAFYSYARWHLGLPPALPVLLEVLAALTAALLVTRWSRSEHWRPAHSLALVGGALATYFWAGPVFVTTPPVDPVNVVGELVLILAAIGLLIAIATRRSAKVSAPSLG